MDTTVSVSGKHRWLYVGDFTREEMLLKVREETEREIRGAQRFLAALDAGEVEIGWMGPRMQRLGPPA